MPINTPKPKVAWTGEPTGQDMAEWPSPETEQRGEVKQKFYDQQTQQPQLADPAGTGSAVIQDRYPVREDDGADSYKSPLVKPSQDLGDDPKTWRRKKAK